ncbi:hypothetical protein HCA61_14085 [Rhodococcus sp. HNM0563]|uniref:hypothetical protein n=1 Tax=unclassified Rhodococcus (in: high G+C Gram-positive bacteria) TaxID=192944 RepID=UPI00146CAC55|nr:MULTISPECIES: hypothetical protein [unclassified Rhodococcus (in: high G+C Gram-positive bacteria)]MCK0092176.1 hypothetical protein [Rhodococcus sp. F64268]NLU63392.1 hypothetical protein [Rhodococcus sp. HNM0563]
MGTTLLTEFRTTDAGGAVALPRRASTLPTGVDGHPPRSEGRSCAHPPTPRIGLGYSLVQMLATVMFTAVAVTAILCVAHVRTSQVAAEAVGTIPVMTDSAPPADGVGAVTDGR